MKFRAKIEGWCYILLAVIALETVYFGYRAVSGESLGAGLLCAGFALLLLFWFMPYCFFTYYQLRERDLYLHIGLLRKLSLPYEYILSAKRIRGGIYAVNPLSLSRFEIRYRQQGGGIGAVIVTPERPDTFIRELLKKNPHIDTTDLPPTQPGEGLDLPFPTVGTKKSKKAPETASRCKNPKGQE
ncbi:MAG TPA: PH domain-containing protein [Firmicutes bacterium]|nr:PH domain-containing protein [Bacillota bacterium]